jgi:hypothetical protein
MRLLRAVSPELLQLCQSLLISVHLREKDAKLKFWERVLSVQPNRLLVALNCLLVVLHRLICHAQVGKENARPRVDSPRCSVALQRKRVLLLFLVQRSQPPVRGVLSGVDVLRMLIALLRPLKIVNG